MPLAAYFSTASTHNVFRGQGTYYGFSVNPVAGGTVVIADLADAGATVDIHSVASTVESYGTFPASPVPVNVPAPGVHLQHGLTVAFTSTMKVTAYYDD